MSLNWYSWRNLCVQIILTRCHNSYTLIVITYWSTSRISSFMLYLSRINLCWTVHCSELLGCLQGWSPLLLSSDTRKISIFECIWLFIHFAALSLPELCYYLVIDSFRRTFIHASVIFRLFVCEYLVVIWSRVERISLANAVMLAFTINVIHIEGIDSSQLIHSLICNSWHYKLKNYLFYLFLLFIIIL